MPSTKITKNRVADFSLREVTEILVKHQDIHEGLYNLTFEFQIAVGAIGPAPESIFPGAMFGVSRVGLSKAETPNIHTVDAAEVNPLTKRRSKRKTTPS